MAVTDVGQEMGISQAGVDCSGHGSQTEDDGWVSKEWFSDGVHVSKLSDLRGGMLPTQYIDDEFEPEITKALAKVDGVKNPRPDFCYGFRNDRFQLPPNLILSTELLYLLKVAPGMEHPFFLVKGKSNKGDIGDAENQARRGGATLVAAARRHIGEPADEVGVDQRTFVCSSTINPSIMDIYLHWAEVISVGLTQERESNAQQDEAEPHPHCDEREQCRSQLPQPSQSKTIFHMTHLQSYALRNKRDLPDLRTNLHNILEWGCIARMPELERLRKQIYAF